MTLSSKELIQLLIQHGFEFKRTKGSHEVYFNSHKNITVVVPLHGKSLKKGTALGILKQAQIKLNQI